MIEKRPVVCGIVAVGPNNIIGHNGVLPWHSRQDFYHFKQKTMGYPCVFGKNTYENLPKKPLPGRLNIVCSSSYNFEISDGVIHVPSLEDAIKQCQGDERIFVCGGAMLYKYALEHDLIDVMYLTRICMYDKDAEKQITEKPSLNTYFPYKFSYRNWKMDNIWYNYRTDFPKELPGVQAAFFKYTRIR